MARWDRQPFWPAAIWFTTISVTNFGPSSAGSVVVTDTLPASVTFVSGDWRWIEQQRRGELEFGCISQWAGEQRNGDVTAPASGSLTNVASVSSPTGDPNLTNNLTPPVITTVTPVADVGIGKSAPAMVSASSKPGLHDFGDELWAVECG